MRNKRNGIKRGGPALTLVPPPLADARIRANGHNGRKGPCEPPFKHSCKAPGQHNLFWWKWAHPGVPLKFAAQDLHLSYNAVCVTHSRLTSREDHDRLCPVCFEAARYDHHCTSCGVEFVTPSVGRQVHDESSPVHLILPGDGKGTYQSDTDLRRIAKMYNPGMDSYGLNLIVGDYKNHTRPGSADDPLELAVKSKVLQALKGIWPPDEVSDMAARLVENFVREMRQRFPTMPMKPKWAIEPTAKAVLARLSQLYPQLPPALREPYTLTPTNSIEQSQTDDSPESGALLQEGESR